MSSTLHHQVSQSYRSLKRWHSMNWWNRFCRMPMRERLCDEDEVMAERCKKRKKKKNWGKSSKTYWTRTTHAVTYDLMMMMSFIDSVWWMRQQQHQFNTIDACYVNHKLPSVIARMFSFPFDALSFLSLSLIAATRATLHASNWFRWFTIDDWLEVVGWMEPESYEWKLIECAIQQLTARRRDKKTFNSQQISSSHKLNTKRWRHIVASDGIFLHFSRRKTLTNVRFCSKWQTVAVDAIEVAAFWMN